MATGPLADKGIHFGSFTGNELIKILPKLASKASSGELRVEDIEQFQQSKIILREGRIVQVISDLLPFHLGDILVKRGMITKKTLEEALNIQVLKREHQQHVLGKILMDFSVKEEVINAGTFRQFEFVFYETLFFPQAEFYFRNIGFKQDLSFSQDPNRQIMEKFTFDLAKGGDKNWPVMALIKPKLPALNYILKKEGNIPLEQLTNDQKDILKSIDGKNTLRDILLISTLDYFGIYATLFQLISMGSLVFIAPGLKIEEPKLKEEPEAKKEESVKDVPASQDKTTTSLAFEPGFQQAFIPQQAQGGGITNYRATIEEQNKKIKQLTAELQKFETVNQIFNEAMITRLAQLPFKKRQIFIKLIETILDMNEVIV